MADMAGAAFSGGATILAVLTVKNEGAFLLDWLAHHAAAGVNRFLVFSNDCSDGTDRILDRLTEMRWVTHLRNAGPYHKHGIQFTALKAARQHALYDEADWILPIDIDEFVNVKVGDHTLQSLLDVLPEATAITLTWRLFGNAGIARDPGGPVTETFTRCAPEVFPWPWRAAMFKTLYRNDGTYGALGVHRPRQPDSTRMDQARWYDGSGRLLPDTLKTEGVFSDFRHSTYDLVQLNHYPLGAFDSYLLKVDRGRVNRTQAPLGMDYWVERNFTQVEDRSILDIAPMAAQWKAALLDDPVIYDLHAQAVSWRQRRFAELMQYEPNRALFGRLLMTPPSRIPSEAEAALLRSHAQAALDSAQGRQ